MTEQKIHRHMKTTRKADRNGSASHAIGPRVNLADLLMILESQNDDACGYLDRDTGKVHLITSEMENGIDQADESILEWMRDDIAAARSIAQGHGDFVPMPSRHEIGDIDLMHRFAQEYDRGIYRNALRGVIGGRGTSRRFREAIRRLALVDAWEAFRVRAYERIAVDWCDANGIGYDPAEIACLDGEASVRAPEIQTPYSENAIRLINEPVYTHVTWRTRAGREQEFIDAWNVLGDLFAELENPPIEVTLIRRADEPTLFHSIGSWHTLADAQSIVDNPAAIDAIAEITELCSEGMPAVFEVVRRVRPE